MLAGSQCKFKDWYKFPHGQTGKLSIVAKKSPGKHFLGRNPPFWRVEETNEELDKINFNI